MITINVRDNAADVIRRLSDTAREQVPFATALALTRTARAVQRELRQEIISVFDQPTPFVVRGTFATIATKKKMQATVGMRDRGPDGRAGPAMYVKEFFNGGERQFKPYEMALAKMGCLPKGWKVVPGAALKRDRYGRPDRKMMAEIFGALGSGMSVFTQPRKQPQARIGYFVVMPGATGRAAHFKHPGIYRRVERGAARAVQSVLIFVTAATYGKRIDLPALARAVVTRDFDSLFKAALTQAQGKPK